MSGALLTVRDVERLAKAGVKIEFTQIAEQVIPDPEAPQRMHHNYIAPTTLVDSFWDRWRRAYPSRADEFGRIAPWQIFAHEYDGIVYVLVCPYDEAPFVLQDHAPLYPSDALMASLSLREKTK